MHRRHIQPQGYGFRSSDLCEIIQQEWDAAEQKPPGYVNRNQAVDALQRAFRRLKPVVPLPSKLWCEGVFQNYDKRDLGVIDVRCFRRIVEQTHNHYATKNEGQAKASMGRQRPEKTNDGVALGFQSRHLFPRDEDDGLAKMLTDYDLVDKSVGKGSFGTVQRVRCRRTGEIFCAKEIEIQDSSQYKHVINEIRIMKSLRVRHPNIVRFKQSYHDCYTAYLIMEYCAGGEFLRRIRTEQYTDKMIASWMTQLLRGLCCLHKAGIIHRDIKPENVVFVSEDVYSDLKIIDFGLACRQDELLKQVNPDTLVRPAMSILMANIAPKINKNVIKEQPPMCEVGTANYMAPEIIKGDYDQKCDVFSLGIILYLLCTGRHPFHLAGDTERDVKNRILSEEPRYEPEEWSIHPREVKSMVKRMLRKDPSRRPDAEVLLTEPWLQIADDQRCGMSKVTTSVLENLKDWEKRSKDQKLRQAFLLLLAVQLSDKDLKSWKRAFVALDRDHDGLICTDELHHVMCHKGLSVTKQDVKRIVRSLDSTGEGRISYDAFLAAVTDTKETKRSELYKRRCEEVFQKFDTQCEGFIDVATLRLALNTTDYRYSEEELDNIFAEVASTGDGKIWKRDFMDLMAAGI